MSEQSLISDPSDRGPVSGLILSAKERYELLTNQEKVAKIYYFTFLMLIRVSSLQKGGSFDRRRHESSRHWPQDGIRERNEALPTLSFDCDEDFSRIYHVHASLSRVS